MPKNLKEMKEKKKSQRGFFGSSSCSLIRSQWSIRATSLTNQSPTRPSADLQTDPDRTDQSADQWGHLARGGGQLANEGSVPSRAPISTIDQVIDHGPGVAKLFFLHPIFLIILLHPSISSSSHLLLLSSVSSSIPPLPPFLSPHRLLLLLVYTSVFFLLCTHFLFPLHLFHFLLDVIKNLILLHLLHLIRFSPNPPSAVIKLVFLRRLLFFTQ